ncbi:hypothetical protein CV093_12325 [Oceanobacillus sp. 143]|nr:hypothetical protein CV093_12325 [Oceanobacillus sp. 143]
MRQILIKISVLVILSILLVACNNKEDNEAEQSDTPVTEEESSSKETENELPEEESGEEEGSDTEDEAETDPSSANTDDLPDDQLGLGIGDTATIKNNFSEHEITLNSVEIKEQAGESTSELGNFVIVDLTVLNTGDEAITADSVLAAQTWLQLIIRADFPGTI